MRKAASCGGLVFLNANVEAEVSEDAMVMIKSPRKKGKPSSLRNEQGISEGDDAAGADKEGGKEGNKEGDKAAGTSPRSLERVQRMVNYASDCRKVIWMDALNTGPTAAVLATAFVFFSALSYFLDQFVVTAQQSVVVFLVGSYVVFTSYFTFHFYLEKYSGSYKSVESEKQFYVLSNLIKSATLLSYTPLAAVVLYNTMVNDEWDTIVIRNLGCMYCIPDFVSLFMVKKMSNTTILHHLAVCVFNAVSMFNDYGEENVCRLMVVYAVFSTFAYLVNLLLASRFLGIPKWLARYMSAGALFIYAACCGINWTWQAYYSHKLWHLYNWPLYAYLSLICLVVYDDLVLMKWLWYKATHVPKPATEASDSNTAANKKKAS